MRQRSICWAKRQGAIDDLRYIILVDRGVMRFQRGRAEAAISDLTAAIKLDPSLCHAYADLAVVLARQGRTAEAYGRFAEAIDRNPRSAPLYRAAPISR